MLFRIVSPEMRPHLRVGSAQSESFEALANSSQPSPECISKLRSDDSKGMRVPEPISPELYASKTLDSKLLHHEAVTPKT